MNTISICLNDTVALSDSTIIELAKVVNSSQPCIHEAQTSCNDVIIVGTICGTIVLICTFLFIIALLWLRKKLKLDFNERNTKLSLDAEERRSKFVHEDEDRKRKFAHEDEDRAWKKEIEEENRKRKLLEENMNSQHIASLREKRLKVLDKVIEKIDDIEDTDYQIWNELAKTIAEITKSVNSK